MLLAVIYHCGTLRIFLLHDLGMFNEDRKLRERGRKHVQSCFIVMKVVVE